MKILKLNKVILLALFSFYPLMGESIDSKISSSSDDAEEAITTGYVNLNSSDLEMTQEHKKQTVGLRFKNITIPKGAVISKAYIQFQTDETSDENTNLTIYGEKVSNASTFSNMQKFDISKRTKTTNAVNWTVPSWLVIGERADAQKTSDIKSIVQEIVDLNNWSSGNSMAFIITGSGKRTAESYNGKPLAAPMLHIEYSTNSTNTNGNNEDTNSTLNQDNIITRSDDDINLKDIEALTYIPGDNALWVADDDKKQIYKIDLNTQTTQRVIDNFNSLKRGSDIKAVAYNNSTDTLYAFGRSSKSVFRLKRDNNGNFYIVDFKKLGVSVYAAVVINNKLYISYYGLLREYNYRTNKISNNTLLTRPYLIYDLAYSNGYLWLLTQKGILEKIDFSTMNIVESFNMKSRGITDARGVEVIGDKLYIADGADGISGDLNHAIYIYDIASSNDNDNNNFDTTPPAITLNGASNITLNLNQNYIELGATAIDDIDGVVSVNITGSVNSSIAGNYTITYSATDSANNQASITRTVTVVDNTANNPSASSDIITRSANDSNLDDIEALTYIPSDNALWVADDDNRQIYKIDLNTQTTRRVISNFDSVKRGSDIKAIAYDNLTDTLYAFGRSGRSVFRLKRDSNGIFTIIDYKNIGIAVYAAVVINGKLYISYSGVVQEYNYAQNRLLGKLFTSKQDIYDMAYGNNILWLVTGDNRLNKVDITTKTIIKRYSMLDRGIKDARGVAVAGDKIYIADGADDISGNLSHAIYIFDINSLPASGNLLSSLEIIKRDFQIPFNPDRADMEAIVYIPSDNAIWITNDDGNHFIYRLNLSTNKVDAYVDGFVAGFDSNIKAQDLEAIAYDINNDTLYVSSGTCGRDTAIFKLTRNANGNFEIVAAHKTDNAFTSMEFINNELYVAYKGREIRKYNFDTKELSDTIYNSDRELYDMAYDNGILWVTTDEKRLIKIDWSNKQIIKSFDMIENSIEDPRGVEVIGDKLYISDGSDWLTSDLKHAMYVFIKP